MVAASHQGSSAALAWCAAWATLWLGAFGVYGLILVPAGFGLFERTGPAALYWAFLSLIVVMLQASELREHGLLSAPQPVARVISLLILAALLATFVNLLLPLRPELEESFRQKQVGLIRLDARYFLGKLPELVFQQLMIFALVRRLERADAEGSGRGPRLVFWFCGIFGLTHLPILILKGLAGWPYVIAASSLGGIFVPLIRRARGGLYDSFGAHLAGYLAVGVSLRALL